MRRALASVLQRFNLRRPFAWEALQAAAQHPKALQLGVDDPQAVLDCAAALEAKYKSDEEIWAQLASGGEIVADDAARMLRLGQMSHIALVGPLTPEKSLVCRALAAENGTTVALGDCETIGSAPSWEKMKDGTDRMLMPTFLTFSYRLVRIYRDGEDIKTVTLRHGTFISDALRRFLAPGGGGTELWYRGHVDSVRRGGVSLDEDEDAELWTGEDVFVESQAADGVEASAEPSTQRMEHIAKGSIRSTVEGFGCGPISDGTYGRTKTGDISWAELNAGLRRLVKLVDEDKLKNVEIGGPRKLRKLLTGLSAYSFIWQMNVSEKEGTAVLRSGRTVCDTSCDTMWLAAATADTNKNGFVSSASFLKAAAHVSSLVSHGASNMRRVLLDMLPNLNVPLTKTIVEGVLKRRDRKNYMTPGTSQMAALYVLSQLNYYYEGELLKDPALLKKINMHAFAHLGDADKPKDAEQMAELTVWALTKSMHASELDVAAMQDILVIILKASLLALQNKALVFSEDGDATEDES